VPGPVLVVDDDLDSRAWVLEALAGAGYETVVASNGAEALMKLAAMETRPCVVLLDLMMPVMNGWEFIAAILRHPVHPNVIVVSAHSHGGIPAGAVDVLQKPVDIDTLLETVKRRCGEP
jgi:CheY-like chemotaxis protein